MREIIRGTQRRATLLPFRRIYGASASPIGFKTGCIHLRLIATSRVSLKNSPARTDIEFLVQFAREDATSIETLPPLKPPFGIIM